MNMKKQKAKRLLALLDKVNNKEMFKMPITKRLPTKNGGSEC